MKYFKIKNAAGQTITVQAVNDEEAVKFGIIPAKPERASERSEKARGYEDKAETIKSPERASEGSEDSKPRRGRPPVNRPGAAQRRNA